MPLRRLDERCQASDEGERFKVDRRSSVRLRLLELQPHDVVLQHLQPVVGQRRTQDVLAQGQSALLVVGGDPGGRVQVEGVGLGAQFAFGNRPIVGVKHDADYLAFVGWVSRRRAENALADPFDELLDLVLRGRRRWVKHLALPLAIRRVHTIQENSVQMRIEWQITVCALNDCHGTGLASRQSTLDVPARRRVRLHG